MRARGRRRSRATGGCGRAPDRPLPCSEPQRMSELPGLVGLLDARPDGLFVPGIEAWIDPSAPAARAVLSHAHADHAAAGHGEVWATPETLAIYRLRNPDW